MAKNIQRSRLPSMKVAFPVLALILVLLCFYTRVAGVIYPLSFALACLATGRGGKLLRREMLVGAGVIGILALPWLYVQYRWGRVVITQVARMGERPLWSAENWVYYFDTLHMEFHWWYVAAVAAALIIGCWRRESRDLTVRMLAAIAFMMVIHTLIRRQDPRYIIGILPLTGVIITRAGGNVVALLTRSSLADLPAARYAGLGLALAVFGFSSLTAANTPVPRVSGIREAVYDVIERCAGERVLYEGYYDGNFTVYHRAHPERESIRVVRGAKVFYLKLITSHFGFIELVKSEEDVRRSVAEYGCRYVLLEPEEIQDIPAARLVRETIPRDPMFEFVCSYPVEVYRQFRVTRLDLYRFLGELPDEPSEEYSFPALDPEGLFGRHIHR